MGMVVDVVEECVGLRKRDEVDWCGRAPQRGVALRDELLDDGLGGHRWQSIGRHDLS